FTERDVLRAAASGTEPERAKVSEWMTEDPENVAPTVAASEALRLLADRGYRHIPVVEDGRLVGIVSMRDLMRVAQIQPVGAPAADSPRGLRGVAVADTEISDVRGAEG